MEKRITSLLFLSIFLKFAILKKNIANFKKILKNKRLVIRFSLKACSSVDRALDSDSKSQGFDSLHAYSSHNYFWGCFGFDILNYFII